MTLNILTKCVLGSALCLYQVEAMENQDKKNSANDKLIYDRMAVKKATDQMFPNGIPKELRDHITQDQIDLNRAESLNRIEQIVETLKVKAISKLSTLQMYVPGATEDEFTAAKQKLDAEVQRIMRTKGISELDVFDAWENEASAKRKSLERIKKIEDMLAMIDINKLSTLKNSVPGATEEELAVAKRQRNEKIQKIMKAKGISEDEASLVLMREPSKG